MGGTPGGGQGARLAVATYHRVPHSCAGSVYISAKALSAETFDRLRLARQRKHVQAWMKAKTYKPTSATKAIGVLNRAINCAVEEERFDPCVQAAPVAPQPHTTVASTSLDDSPTCVGRSQSDFRILTTAAGRSSGCAGARPTWSAEVLVHQFAFDEMNTSRTSFAICQ